MMPWKSQIQERVDESMRTMSWHRIRQSKPPYTKPRFPAIAFALRFTGTMEAMELRT